MVAVAVASAVVLGGVPTAMALAADAAPATPVATASPVVAGHTTPLTIAAPVTRKHTAVHHWRATSRTVTAGKSLRVHVRVSGGTRTVRLERQLHGRWVVVDHGIASAAGRVTLHWHAPAAPKRAVLRLHVLHTATFRAALTTHRAVTVRAAAAPSGGTSAADAVRAQLFSLVNTARATARTCGSTHYPAVPALQRSTALDRAAGDYATTMAAQDFFSHTGKDGSTMVSRLAAVGITNTSERENIAAGQTSAASVMAAWLGSPGHCANLMAGDVTRIGLGHATDSGSTYGQYWVQDFAG